MRFGVALLDKEAPRTGSGEENRVPRRAQRQLFLTVHGSGGTALRSALTPSCVGATVCIILVRILIVGHIVTRASSGLYEGCSPKVIVIGLGWGWVRFCIAGDTQDLRGHGQRMAGRALHQALCETFLPRPS
jgi:hypothetical protein